MYTKTTLLHLYIANVVKLNHDYVRNKKIDARLCNAEEKIDLL